MKMFSSAVSLVREFYHGALKGKSSNSLVQRLLLDREPELFDDRLDDELRDVFVPDDFADLDFDPLPPDDLLAADLPALGRDDDREFALPLLAVFAPPLFREDELDDVRFEEEPVEPLLVEELRFADESDELLFADEPLADLTPLEREEPPRAALDRLPLAERDEPPPEEAELRLPFDPDDALLPAERDLPLPLDLPAFDFPADERELPLDDEPLDDDDLVPPLEVLPLMFEASAVCTTLAAPSTAPIAALVKSVPAASAALDNKPFEPRFVRLDF